MKLIDGADIVIHCAGYIGHPSSIATDFQIALNQINVITNVLEACYKQGVKRFLDLNSSTGYPDKPYAITEDEYFDGEPFISYYNYGWMRRYRETLMEHTSHLCDMHIGIARGTAVFGPHDNFDLESCHVVPALIKRCLSGEDPFVVWGSPDVVRDFLYIKDVVKGALLILENGESMKPYNVGYGSTVTIGDIVDTILKVTDKSPEVQWDNSKPTTIPFRACSTERIKTELGFEPDYTFERGIRETIEWYENNL
jgi:GDP-L-fucose synthase